MSLPPFNHDDHTKFTESPNPAWSYCQTVDSTPAGREWLKGEEKGWKIINTAEHDRLELYKLMISGIVPRPIAFVASISTDGVENLAPFSWFNMVSSWPPLVYICCANGPGGKLKDTAINVRNGNGFTVNIISEPFVENANVTSVDAPRDFDEWSITGLTKAPSVHVKPPRVKESAFSMECELFQAIDIAHPDSGERTSVLILGHVKYIHVRNDMLTERGLVDVTKFKPVARMGDITYTSIGDAFRIPRPVWAQEESKLQSATQRL